MGKIKPEHFDILGVFFFPFILVLGLYMLKSNGTLPQPFVIILIISGVVGFIIDGTIVYHFLIKETKK